MGAAAGGGGEEAGEPQQPQQPQHPQQPSDGGSTPAELEYLRQLGQFNAPPDSDSSFHCLSIIGQIEGHLVLPPKNKTTKYEHVMPQLVAVEQNPKVKGLLILLNTVGGDIEAGLAIAEMVRTLSKPTVSVVLGGGHSIGAPIAVAADYSFIAETATVTIHPIRLTGLVIGVPQTYEYLDKMQDRVIRFLVDNSRISEVKLRELMFRTGELVRDIGTVLIGREAVNVGLVDEVGGVAAAVSRLQQMIQNGKVPKRARGQAQAPAYPAVPAGPGPGGFGALYGPWQPLPYGPVPGPAPGVPGPPAGGAASRLPGPSLRGLTLP